MKLERKWVVAGLLDLRGFRAWTRRASIAPEVKERFIVEFYRLLQCYVKKHRGPWNKYEGDALLSAREFDISGARDRRSILNFMLDMRCLFRKVKALLRDFEAPPERVRIRWISGYVYKLMVTDPNDEERLRLIPEYVDYCLNTLWGMIEVNPEVDCLATADLVKLLGKQAEAFRVRPLGKPSSYPKGVDKEDVDGLQILRF